MADKNVVTSLEALELAKQLVKHAQKLGVTDLEYHDQLLVLQLLATVLLDMGDLTLPVIRRTAHLGQV